MSKDNDKLLTDHDYDGIQELDNPLPRWWVNLFYLTIVFAVVYFSYYQLMGGPTSQQELESKMAQYEAAKSVEPKNVPAPEAVDVKALLADAEVLKTGKEVFLQFCAACHGQKGEGGIGPNLTDKYWIHSKGDMAGILAALRKGFPDKGMPPWGTVIPANQHNAVSAFVFSLIGTNPPNAKASQGNLIE